MAVTGHLLPEAKVLTVIRELEHCDGGAVMRLYSQSGELLATHDPRVGNGYPDWYGKPANQQAVEMDAGGLMVWKM